MTRKTSADEARLVGMLNRASFALRAEPKSGGCLLWRGQIHEKGYGILRVDRKNIRAHRAAWIMANGPIPDGLIVCHRCDVRTCVNADHLFLGTNLDNVNDALAKGRLPRGSQKTLAKLTDQSVREIRTMREQGISYDALAWLFGVCKRTVREAAIGISWRHVT